MVKTFLKTTALIMLQRYTI